MQREHGFPILLAESFVDRARFAGTCYRAANWRSLGFTGGYARQPAAVPEWRHHGQPKEVLVYALEAQARAALGQPEEDSSWQGPARTAPPSAPQLRSMFECLGAVPDYRCARGQRYRLRTVLVLAMAARLAGYRGVTAFAQFAALLDPAQRQAVGCFYSPSRHRYTTPSITTFHNILATLPPETLEQAVAAWTRQQNGQAPPDEEDTGSQEAAWRVPGEDARQALLVGIAMDGKDLRGASKQTPDGRRMLVAAVEHSRGRVLGQVEVDSKTNEIPAVRELAAALELAGRAVTLDALHAQQETARSLLEGLRWPLPDHQHQGQPANAAGRPPAHAVPGRSRPRDPRQGARPHRAPPLLGEGSQRPGLGRLCRPVRPPAGHPHRARAAGGQERRDQHRSELRADLADGGAGHAPRSWRR